MAVAGVVLYMVANGLTSADVQHLAYHRMVSQHDQAFVVGELMDKQAHVRLLRPEKTMID